MDKIRSHRQLKLLVQTLFIVFTCFLLAQFFSAGILAGFGVSDISGLQPDNLRGIAIFKLAHFVSSVMSFIVPALLIAWLVYRNAGERLLLNRRVDLAWFALAALIIFVAMPWLNALIQWNESIRFPEKFTNLYNSFRSSEDFALRMTKLMLTGNSGWTLLLNVFLIALIPALGEEFLFRGIIQRYLHDVTRNVHVAIWVSAVLFSAIHFQFFGFFARTLLGAFFGYLVYYSGSMWVAVWAHFFNNAMAVLAQYFIAGGGLPEQADKFGSQGTDWGWAVVSLGATVALFIILIRKHKSELRSR